jgi:hypothetical protein
MQRGTEGANVNGQNRMMETIFWIWNDGAHNAILHEVLGHTRN